MFQRSALTLASRDLPAVPASEQENRMYVYILQGSQHSPSRRKEIKMEQEQADAPHYGLNPG